MELTSQLSTAVGISAACQSLHVARGLVQQGASAFGHRHAHSADGALRLRGRGDCGAPPGAGRSYRKHRERFVRQTPEPLRLPAAVWINPPVQTVQDSSCGPSAEKLPAPLFAKCSRLHQQSNHSCHQEK